MIKFKYLILVALLVACKKDLLQTDIGSSSCKEAKVPSNYLIGKWKFIKWSAATYNVSNCTVPTGASYIASDYNINFILEVSGSGVFRSYFQDSLVNESICTRQSFGLNNTGEGYGIACGDLSIEFRNLNPLLDSLQNVSVGDTIKINNPFLEVNFANGQFWTIASFNEQFYVKIE